MNYFEVAKNLVDWFKKNHRKLPFRETKDPYAIWISEIMAQQTQIVQLLPYYQRWMQQWPTIEALAKANLTEVNKAWEGLGYYSRARNILRTSQIVEDQYQGLFPKSYQEIRELPGIGDYTAGAIVSIAYNQPKAAVDGNVIRVLSRLLMDDRDFSKLANKRDLETVILELMKYQEPALITEALMEIGALVCLPRNPDCLNCPLKADCLAFKNQVIDKYPYRKAAKPKQEEFYNVFIYINSGQLLVSTDDSDGLMKKFLRLPQSFQDQTIPFKKYEKIMTSKHTFSHKIWYLDVYRVKEPIKKLPSTQLIDLDSLEDHAWITAHKKILSKILSD